MIVLPLGLAHMLCLADNTLLLTAIVVYQNDTLMLYAF